MRASRAWIRPVVGMVAAVVGVAVCARLSFPIPGAPVPQSAQTLAVLIAGALLGPVFGPLSMILYWIVGALGLPVFADGRAGLDAASGSSLGYFVGFVLAAWLLGRSAIRESKKAGEEVRESGETSRLAVLSVDALVAHLVILTSGTLWLTQSMSLNAALAAGFTPFVVGALVKSIVAGVVVLLVSRHSYSTQRTTP